jgi:SsrA-binding protein
MSQKKPKTPSGTICINKKARFDYFLNERFETGLVLQGWEVKSLRAGRIQIRDAYILMKEGEAWLLGSLVTPLSTASTHITADAQRTRKLLLHRKELNKLNGALKLKGQAIVPTAMYWKNNRIKLEIALAIGKKSFDKRDTEKERDWNRQKERLFKK